MYHPVTLL